MSAPVDFSSFAPDVEQRFVPFEQAMRDNARHANRVGAAVAGGLLVVLLAVCVGLYSPCNSFCARPPGPCHTPAQVAAWRTSCETTCGAVEHSSGLTMDIEVPVPGSKDTRVAQVALGGGEYVRDLNACVFSGGGGLTCSSLVKTAKARGLWCDEGK